MGLLSGPPVKFTVTFSQPLYFGGDVISGTVVVDSEKELTVRNVIAHLIGEEHCHWTEGHGDIQRDFTGHHRILDAPVTLWVGAEHSEKYPAGKQTFQFSFPPLPADAPKSFRTGIGYIQYVVNIKLDIPMGRDAELNTELTVYPKPDSLIAIAQNGVRSITQSTKPCCMFSKGTVVAQFSVPESPLYVNEQSVLLANCNINNETSRKVACSVQVIRTIVYTASSRTKVSKLVLGTLTFNKLQETGGKIPAIQTFNETIEVALKDWLPVNEFTIPGHAVSVFYTLGLKVKPRWSLGCLISIPIVFGPAVGGPSSPDGPALSLSSSAAIAPAPQVVATPSVAPQAAQSVYQPQARAALSKDDPVFEKLLSELTTTFSDKTSFARDFLAKEGATKPSPEQLARAVSQVFSLQQDEFIQAIAPHLQGITCAHAVAVLQSASTSTKRDILRSLAPLLGDKAANKHVIIDSASMLDQDDYAQILA